MFLNNYNDKINYILEAKDLASYKSQMQRSLTHLLKWKYLHNIQCASYVNTIFGARKELLNNTKFKKRISNRDLYEIYLKSIKEVYEERDKNQQTKWMNFKIPESDIEEFDIDFFIDEERIIEYLFLYYDNNKIGAFDLINYLERSEFRNKLKPYYNNIKLGIIYI